ncbi:EI24 domain-containing protein [Saccharothrix algeriensis]|uniref:EI24 domain-containing protein n=1 Tax=Saccharothrix algeriensis TaxID=173560 RepID=A0A8T8I6B8_9PSEU|nr:EI24 domain-containing protein [Saccharothrix algeriensis]QTR06362.1 EI24 domain-containing protein [Saccharothrix algeriensis]
MLRDFSTGVGLLAKGFGLVFRSPKLLLIGAVPALVTTVLLIGSLVALGAWIDEIAAWATPFADDWDETLRTATRFAAGVSIIGAYVAVGLLLFSAITLVIGGPFYEHIAETVEDEHLGGVPEAQRASWARSAGVGLRDGVLLVGLAVLCAVPLFLAGFIPVVGQTVVPVVAVCVNATLLGIELTGIPFTRRGLKLDVRRRVLRRRRAVTLGFAVPTYLLCLIPLAALVVFPAAMAGGTVLAHRLLHDELS